jgi:hypothetical protein
MLNLTELAGLIGREISPWQGLYLHRTIEKHGRKVYRH